ncbi:MAG: DUF4031 domain-containing protein [Actinomycetota bacterium]|nr:DUF4031 domain-containing protein [Actinomycetota bacterium]
MTVYVDDVRDYGTRVGARLRRVGTEWCHLTADSRQELHAFAQQLGVRRSWFQDDPVTWHYDLTPQQRTRAVRLGASELSRREMGRLIAERRAEVAETGRG